MIKKFQWKILKNLCLKVVVSKKVLLKKISSKKPKQKDSVTFATKLIEKTPNPSKIREFPKKQTQRKSQTIKKSRKTK